MIRGRPVVWVKKLFDAVPRGRIEDQLDRRIGKRVNHGQQRLQHGRGHCLTRDFGQKAADHFQKQRPDGLEHMAARVLKGEGKALQVARKIGLDLRLVALACGAGILPSGGIALFEGGNPGLVQGRRLDQGAGGAVGGGGGVEHFKAQRRHQTRSSSRSIQPRRISIDSA